MKLIPDLCLVLDRSYVEPRSYPDVFNAEHQARDDLDGQRQHDDEEYLHGGDLQQAHALENLAGERRQVHELVNADGRTSGVNAADDRSEDDLGDASLDAEDIREVAIDGEFEAVVIPGHARPEPHPAGTADESADDDHGDPQNDEAENEGEDGELALLECVIAVPQRVGIDIRNDHQAH